MKADERAGGFSASLEPRAPGPRLALRAASKRGPHEASFLLMYYASEGGHSDRRLQRATVAHACAAAVCQELLVVEQEHVVDRQEIGVAAHLASLRNVRSAQP